MTEELEAVKRDLEQLKAEKEVAVQGRDKQVSINLYSVQNTIIRSNCAVFKYFVQGLLLDYHHHSRPFD